MQEASEGKEEEMSADRFRFRAWMPNQEYMDNALGNTSTGWLSLEKECVIMQSTGLSDKNGKEIFEGDILRSGSTSDGVCYDDSDSTARVSWEDGDTGFWLVHPSQSYWCRLDSGEIDGLKLEIIGNIHENPELLEAK
jgi:uncharacterized phage protein (TIGR01671 family)